MVMNVKNGLILFFLVMVAFAVAENDPYNPAYRDSCAYDQC